MKEYLCVLSQIVSSLCLCYEQVIHLYFQFFPKKIIYIYCYNDSSTYLPPKLVYSYWMSYLYPLSLTLSNEMYCPSGSLLEIIHNTDNEQVTTIIRKNDFHQYLSDSFEINDKLTKDVLHIKTTHKNKLKNIMFVSVSDSVILTDYFKNIAHSFHMTQIKTTEFIQFIRCKKHTKDVKKDKHSLTLIDDNFDEHVFKKDDVILW